MKTPAWISVFLTLFMYLDYIEAISYNTIVQNNVRFDFSDPEPGSSSEHTQHSYVTNLLEFGSLKLSQITNMIPHLQVLKDAFQGNDVVLIINYLLQLCDDHKILQKLNQSANNIYDFVAKSNGLSNNFVKSNVYSGSNLHNFYSNNKLGSNFGNLKVFKATLVRTDNSDEVKVLFDKYDQEVKLNQKKLAKQQRELEERLAREEKEREEQQERQQQELEERLAREEKEREEQLERQQRKLEERLAREEKEREEQQKRQQRKLEERLACEEKEREEQLERQQRKLEERLAREEKEREEQQKRQQQELDERLAREEKEREEQLERQQWELKKQLANQAQSRKPRNGLSPPQPPRRLRTRRPQPSRVLSTTVNKLKSITTTKEAVAAILKSRCTEKSAHEVSKIKSNDSTRLEKEDSREWAKEIMEVASNAQVKTTSPKVKISITPSSPTKTAIFQVPEDKKLTPSRVTQETTDFWNLKDHPSWDFLFSLVNPAEYSPAYTDSSSSNMSADEQQKDKILKKYKKYKKRKRHYQHLLFGKLSKKSKHSTSSEELAHSADSKEKPSFST